MARPNRGSGTYFGFAGMALLDHQDRVIGQSAIPGEFNADIVAEQIDTMGGASTLPLESRAGRASGEVAITLRERPTWIDEELLNAVVTETAAANAPAAGSVTNVIGTTVSGLTVAVANTVTDYMDVEVEATGAAELTVRVGGSLPQQIVEGFAVTNNATPVESTGVSLSQASPAYNVGDRARFVVYPAHGGIRTIAVPQLQTGGEYRMKFWSREGGPGDHIQIYDAARVSTNGASYKLTDNETQGDVEITGKLLAPYGGGSPLTSYKILKP